MLNYEAMKAQIWNGRHIWYWTDVGIWTSYSGSITKDRLSLDRRPGASKSGPNRVAEEKIYCRHWKSNRINFTCFATCYVHPNATTGLLWLFNAKLIVGLTVHVFYASILICKTGFNNLHNIDTGWGHPVELYYKIHNICSYSQTQLSIMSLIKSTHLATGFDQTWSSSGHIYIYTKIKAVHGLRCKCRS